MALSGPVRGLLATEGTVMADQESIQHLEEVEKAVQHVVNLLTEADQALERCGTFIDSYNTAHHLNPARGTAIADSLKNIQSLISNYTNEHNKVVGQIAEAKDEAAQRNDDADPGY